RRHDQESVIRTGPAIFSRPRVSTSISDYWYLIADPCSVHADRLQLLTPGIGDCGFAAVGEHDRRAISGVQGKQLLSRRHLRHIGLWEQGLNVLGSDRLDVSDAAVAKLGQRLRRH